MNEIMTLGEVRFDAISSHFCGIHVHWSMIGSY